MNRFAVSLAALSLLTGTIALVPRAVVARQAPQAALALPTTTAKTAQVTVTQWGVKAVPAGQPFGPLTRIRASALTLDVAGNRGRVQEVAEANAPADYKPSYAVYDGTAVFNFMGQRNQYTKLPTATLKDGLGGGFALPGVALVFGWKNGEAAKFKPAPDETVESMARKVYAYSYDVTTRTGKATVTQKLYVDPATKLPARFSYFVRETGAAETEALRTEFTDWKLDAPVDAARMAWTPPKGSSEYKAPERPPLLAAGTVAPDFTCEKLEGGPLRLSDYRGKVVILDFWATWCGPCQMSMPHIEKIARQVKGKDVVVIALCVWDEKAEYEAWMPKNRSKYSFQFAFDPAGRGPNDIAKSLYKVSGIPTTYVIGRDGKVVDAHLGFQPDDPRIAESLAKVGVQVPREAAQAK